MGFMKLCRTNSWSAPVQATCPLERISVKLKRLARALQSWSHKQVGHINSQLGFTREIVHLLEIAQDHRSLNQEEDWLRREAKRHCLVLASPERTVARLCSRIRFLKDGDANTAYSIDMLGFGNTRILYQNSWMVIRL